MKVTSLIQGSGKVGEMVLAQSGGECISREYRKNVSNPNTTGQVDARAKLKLMSQISAAMANVIVIPKKGLQSSRNLFVKKNYDLAVGFGAGVGIDYTRLQLTNGNAGFPQVKATKNGTTSIDVQLASSAAESVNRVVYNIFSKTDEGQLQFVDSLVVTDPGNDGTFPASLAAAEGDVIIYGYGMKDLNSKATAKYGNYNVNTGEDIAKLFMQRTLKESDYKLTQTSGNEIPSDESGTHDVPDGKYGVTVVIFGNGTVNGEGDVTKGDPLTLTAVPAEGWRFSYWKDEAGRAEWTTNPYTFVPTQTMRIQCVFEPIA